MRATTEKYNYVTSQRLVRAAFLAGSQGLTIARWNNPRILEQAKHHYKGLSRYWERDEHLVGPSLIQSAVDSLIQT